MLWFEDVPLVEFMYLVFTRMPGESYRRRLRSLLLCLCDVFRTLINSLVCWFYTNALSLVLLQNISKGISHEYHSIVRDEAGFFYCCFFKNYHSWLGHMLHTSAQLACLFVYLFVCTEQYYYDVKMPVALRVSWTINGVKSVYARVCVTRVNE